MPRMKQEYTPVATSVEQGEEGAAEMNVDDMLEKAGDFGRYQLLLMLLFSLINILSAFHYFAQTFISIVPPHECPISTTLAQLRPTYNLTNGYNSIVSELDWVCEDAWKPAMGQSMYFVGSVLGSLGLGVMADHIGRLPMLVLSNLIAFLGNVATAFTWGLPEFAASRFVAGLATDTNFYMMYIIVMEYLRPGMRTMGINLCIGLFYCLACVAVPWVALVSGSWRLFLLVVSSPLLLVPVYYFLLPESARWLINRGRVAEAIACFQQVARFNGRCIPQQDIEDFKLSAGKLQSERTSSLLGLFRTPRLRRKTCILIFKSMVMTLGYDAIARNVEHAPGLSPFVLFSISSATILPSCIVILLIQDRVGRKAVASSSLLLTGLFMGAAGIVQATVSISNKAVLTATLGVIGRFGINIAYNSGAQYAAELIPTEVRGQGVAAVHVAGYAATFFSPHILYLANIYLALPELLLCLLCVTGAVLCLWLPETMGKDLPLTMEDGEHFGEDEGIWEFACCTKKDSSTNTAPE